MKKYDLAGKIQKRGPDAPGDIEGGEIVVCHHINPTAIWSINSLLQFDNKKIKIICQKRLLLEQRTVGKGMCEKLSHASMIGLIGGCVGFNGMIKASRRVPYQ